MASRIVYPPVEIGSMYTRLAVTELTTKLRPSDKRPRKAAKANCSCGATDIVVLCIDLQSGHTRSCGCLSREKSLAARLQKRKNPEGSRYTAKSFDGARLRCTNPNNKNYARYGGRGITFEFANVRELIADIGFRPLNTELDRIDNNQGYRKGNVRWVPKIENTWNRRSSFWWHVDGIRYESCAEAGKANGVTAKTIVNWCKGGKAGNCILNQRPNCWAERKYPDKTDAASLLSKLD